MSLEFLVEGDWSRVEALTGKERKFTLLYSELFIGITLFVLRYLTTGASHLGEPPGGTTRRKYPEEPPPRATF